MKQTEIIKIIESVAPLSLAASWDTSGMQVAARRETVTHLAVCLDPTPESVRAALQIGADMVLAHHPLGMEGVRLNALGPMHTVVAELLGHDVPLYASHTSLDANPSGPVTWLARELGLTDCAVLEPAGRHEFTPGESCECGFGVVGNLPEPLDMSALMERLQPWIQHSSVRLAGLEPACVSRVAVCPGSGSSLADAAARLGANVLITGDLKYHAALDAPLCLVDVGHFALEEEMMRRFALQLADLMPSLAITFVASCDPLRAFATHHTVQE